MKKFVSILTAVVCSASLLVGCSSGGNTESEPADDTQAQTAQDDVQESSEGYTIYVMEQDSMSPIQGVRVQLCSDTTCLVAKTDDNGIASFDVEPGDYTVHLNKMPEGYEKNTEEYTLDKDNREATFFLNKLETEGQTEENTDTTQSEAFDPNMDLPGAGFSFTAPDEWKDLSGKATFKDWGEIDKENGTVIGYVSYQAVTEADIEEYLHSIGVYTTEDYTDEKMDEMQKFWDKYPNLLLFRVMGVKGNQDLEKMKKEMFDRPIAVFDEIGKAGDYTFYYIVLDDESVFEELRDTDYPKDKLEEAYKLWQEAATTNDLKERITVKEPVPLIPTIEEGSTVSFTATDLDGNTVTSKELFADHKITMINFWATWCHNCKNEMEELEAMSKEWADKGVQIIGICEDAEDEEMITSAKNILDKYGVTYTNLCLNEEISQKLPYGGLPTTFFVDSEGKILCEPVMGAYPDQYKEALEKLVSETK